MEGLSVPGPSGARIVHKPFGVVAGIRKVSAVLWGSVSRLPAESSFPPVQCIKYVIFPLHVCVCSVLPDPGVAFLPYLCLHSLSGVPFGMCGHWRQGRPVHRVLWLQDGGRSVQHSALRVVGPVDMGPTWEPKDAPSLQGLRVSTGCSVDGEQWLW